MHELVTTVEATTILRCERSSITRWVANGRLVPVRKLPGRTGAFLFDRADIEALAVELATDGDTPPLAAS